MVRTDNLPGEVGWLNLMQHRGWSWRDFNECPWPLVMLAGALFEGEDEGKEKVRRKRATK